MSLTEATFMQTRAALDVEALDFDGIKPFDGAAVAWQAEESDGCVLQPVCAAKHRGAHDAHCKACGAVAAPRCLAKRLGGDAAQVWADAFGPDWVCPPCSHLLAGAAPPAPEGEDKPGDTAPPTTAGYEADMEPDALWDASTAGLLRSAGEGALAQMVRRLTAALLAMGDEVERLRSLVEDTPAAQQKPTSKTPTPAALTDAQQKEREKFLTTFEETEYSGDVRRVAGWLWGCGSATFRSTIKRMLKEEFRFAALPTDLEKAPMGARELRFLFLLLDDLLPLCRPADGTHEQARLHRLIHKIVTRMAGRSLDLQAGGGAGGPGAGVAAAKEYELKLLQLAPEEVTPTLLTNLLTRCQTLIREAGTATPPPVAERFAPYGREEPAGKGAKGGKKKGAKGGKGDRRWW